MEILKKSAIGLLLAAVALFSIAVITPAAVKQSNHMHTYEQLDKEISNTLKLTAGATAVSAVITLLPDDTCTPIAEQFAELGTYFVVVLSALYLEKYLITILGFVAFSILIPLVCLIFGIGIIGKKEKANLFALKLGIFAILIYFLIPISVKTSEAIYNTYESTLEDTLTTATEITVTDEDAGAVEKFLSWIKNAAVTVVDYVTDLLSRFVEAVAVMMVTSCLIPILVVLLFSWLMRLLFKIDISFIDIKLLPGKKRHMVPKIGDDE
ncbi:MAG: hypothetical protein IKR39_11710 [Lachnospiraceae bacterium]|nr:hypothetical protein [Lachnospiraceae bacterium]